jgi:hypothetical protein
VTDREVGGCDHRLHSREQWSEVITTVAASLGILLCPRTTGCYATAGPHSITTVTRVRLGLAGDGLV